MKNRGTLFSHPADIMLGHHTNGKSIYQRQNFGASGLLKAKEDNREGCDVRKYVIQLVTTIL